MGDGPAQRTRDALGAAPAPPRATTPLPGSFTLTEDPSTQEFDGGTVLLGGSPLRLFRISERAQRLVERWRNGAAVGPRRSAQLLARRLVSGGAFTPQPTASTLGPGDVTVVVPVRDRPAQLDRLLDASRQGLACIVVDDASADAGATKEIAERHGAAFIGLATNVGPAGARNAGLAAVHSPLVAFVDSDCVPAEGGSSRLLGHFDDPLVAAVAPRIVRGRPAPARATRRRARRSTGAPRQARCGPGAAFPSSPARRSWSGPTWRRDPTCSIRRSAAARTSTWSGAWARPAGTCATSRPAPSPTKARPR